MIAAGFAAGSVPFSNLAARHLRGIDLRDVGSGTVSGTALHEVAGFGPLAVVGILEVAKGAVGPLLAGRGRPVLSAVAAGAAVVGHDWSPWLRGAGGRGISPAIGALLVGGPAGAGVLLAGLAGGRLAHQTALGSLVADAVLVPVVATVHGPRGRNHAVAVVVPLLVKRIMGNRPAPAGRRVATGTQRLLFDRDGGSGDEAGSPEVETVAAGVRRLRAAG